jgi:hypothetical protein
LRHTSRLQHRHTKPISTRKVAKATKKAKAAEDKRSLIDKAAASKRIGEQNMAIRKEREKRRTKEFNDKWEAANQLAMKEMKKKDLYEMD